MQNKNITVTKKDGTTECFDTDKIVTAITKSADRIGRTLSKADFEDIINTLKQNINQSIVHVSDLHKMVVSALKENYPDVAKSYQDYRDYKLTYAKDFDTLFQETKDVLYLGDRENANFDSALISTKGSLIRGYLTKKLYQRFYLTKREAELTRRGDIYVHDLRDMISGAINCLRGNQWVTIRENGEIHTLTLDELRAKLSLGEGVFGLSRGIQVLSRNGWVNLEGISVRRLNPNETVFKIKARNGLSLEATANHRIPVIDKSGNEMVKYVSDIKKGDSLIMISDVSLEPSDDFIDLLDYVDEDKTFVHNIKYLKRFVEYRYNQSLQELCRKLGVTFNKSLNSIRVREFKKIRTAIQIPYDVYIKLTLSCKGASAKIPPVLARSVELAKMLGCVFADGCVSKVAPYGTYQVNFSNTNQNLINDYIACARTVFPDVHVVLSEPSEKSSTPCTAVNLCNACVHNFFGTFKKNANDIRIPDFIMSGSDELKYSFITAAMDCDGCYGSTQFYYSTVCEKYAHQFLLLLQSLGYNPTIQKRESANTVYKAGNVTGTRNFNTFKVVLSKIEEQERLLRETEKLRHKTVNLSERVALPRNPCTIMSIDEQYPENEYVYDLQTGDSWIVVNNFIVHNCCLFDFESVLKDGFEMAGVKYTEPKTVLATLQVIGDITLSATGQQFGGFTISELDRVLVPFCEKTLNTARAEFDQWFDGSDTAKREAYAEKKLRRELEQGFQSLELKLNTVCSSRGDFGFTTITFGAMPANATEEQKRLQRLVGSVILQTRKNGHGPDHVAVVFPKLVYLYSKEQHKDPEQQKLFDEALECSAKCMYPDYLSIDADYGSVSDVFKEQGVITSPMGCRAYLTPWKDPETGKYVTIGRCNIGAVSINIPLLWEIAKYEHPEAVEDTFFEILDDRMEVIREFLRKRYDLIAGMPASSNPMAFTQGGFYHGTKAPSEKVGDLTEYMTASFGYIGLDEVTKEARGCSLYDDRAQFAAKILKRINDNIARYKEEDHHLYAIYGTPAESYCGTASKQLSKYLDSIGEHEKALKVPDFLTNSFHAHVSENITPFEKQDAEFECFHLSAGGHIQYVRIDDPTNLAGLKAIVERGMELGFYQGVNFNSMYCQDCHHHSVPKGNNILECPLCHSHNTVTISRVCGYLGYSNIGGKSRMNDSKLAELSERKSM